MYTFSTQSLCNTIKQIHQWKIKFTLYSHNNYWYYNQNGLLLKLLLLLNPILVRMAVMSTTKDALKYEHHYSMAFFSSLLKPKRPKFCNLAEAE